MWSEEADIPTTRIRTRDLTLGLIALAVVGVVLWLMGQGGYPAGPDECIALGDCYCEAIHFGALVAQPANSWSNGGFALVGLLVLAGFGGLIGSSLIATENAVRRMYGGIALFLAVGSFLFHGTMRAWGGYLDLLSMHAFIAFLLAYDITRIRGGGLAMLSKWFWPLLAGFAVVLGLVRPEYGKVVFAALVVVTLVVEFFAGRGATVVHRWPWFWTGLGVFVAANVVWNLSRTPGPWCDPDSLFQGHALWHLLSALTVWCLYKYLLADERAGESVG